MNALLKNALSHLKHVPNDAKEIANYLTGANLQLSGNLQDLKISLNPTTPKILKNLLKTQAMLGCCMSEDTSKTIAKLTYLQAQLRVQNAQPLNPSANFSNSDNNEPRQFFIINLDKTAPKTANKTLLFYKSSGANSGHPGTVFPTGGVSQVKIEKPEIADFIYDKKYKKSMFKNLVDPTKLDLLNMKEILDKEFTPAVFQKFMESDIDNLETLGRFGDLQSMKISCAIGGGIWEDTDNVIMEFTSWFKAEYKKDILAYRNQITKSQLFVSTQEVDNTKELIKLLPVAKYKLPVPAGIKKLKDENDQQYIKNLGSYDEIII